MAFDHTQKSNYHYIDISNIDESLLNNPLYPNRPTESKYKLCFSDVAFLYEALLSRYNPFKGVTFNGSSLATSSTLNNFAISSPALTLQDLSINDYLVTRLPSNTLYTSESAAEAAELGLYAFSEDYKGNAYSSSRSFRFIYVPANYADDDTWWLYPIKPLSPTYISLGYDLVTKSSPYKYYYYPYSKSILTPTYSDVINQGSPTLRVQKIQYSKTSLTSGGETTVDEGYRINTADFYSLSLDEAVKNCVNIRVFALVNFSNQYDSNNNYRFVELTTPNGTTNSYRLLEMGKSLLPPWGDSTSQYQYVRADIRALYVFAESKVDISI